MEYLKNIVEYYDELYVVSEAQQKFYDDLIDTFPKPVRLLRTNCGTGYFEHCLAKEGLDVTGIETDRDLLKSANLRRRNQLMAVRFFEMSTLDMARFLGKGFYNIISSLESRICFTHGETLIKKFFFDAKQLLAPGGILIVSLINFNKYKNGGKIVLAPRESIRTKLNTQLIINPGKDSIINQTIETGNGRILPILEDSTFYPLTPEEIQKFGKEAGFKQIEMYSDFSKSPFTGTEDNVIVVLR